MKVVTNQPHPRSVNLASRKPRNPLLTWKDYGPLGRFIFWISLSYMLIGLVGGIAFGLSTGGDSDRVSWPYVISGGLGMMLSVAIAMLERRVRDLEELVRKLTERELENDV